MSRLARAAPLWLFLLLTSCGTVNDELRPTPALPEARTVFIPRGAARPRVQVSEEELRAAMRVLLTEVRMPVRFGSRATGWIVVPAAAWEPLDHEQLAMARDYRMWCERRHEPSDCLDVLRSRPVLTQDGKYKIAFDIALGAQWKGFAGELSGMADPALVRVVLLGTMVAYMGAIAFPEVITKGIAAAATVVLTAYLGAEAVWNLVFGWIHMVEEVKAATTFAQVRSAGERYGNRVGAQTARVLVMVATCMLAQAGRFLALVMRLPKAAEASTALAADTGGKLVLADVGQVSAANVSATGVTVVLAPAAEGAQQVLGVAMAARGTVGTATPNEGCQDDAQWHHIATVENSKSPLRGGPWTPRFKRLFERAGLSMENAANKVRIRGHRGPHPEEYHRRVFGQLLRALGDCPNVEKCRRKLTVALESLSRSISTPGSDLHDLVTRGCR